MVCLIFRRIFAIIKRNTALAFFLRGCNQSNPSSFNNKDSLFELNEKNNQKLMYNFICQKQKIFFQFYSF